MNFDTFLYNCILRGFKIMGINAKKIERIKTHRENLKIYHEFLKTLNLKPIEEYFELGVEAEAFRMPPNSLHPKGKLLGKNDNLFWGFNSKGYQYTLRRQPLNTGRNNVDSIMNEMFQKGMIKREY